MKKLLITLISLTIFTSYIVGMEKEEYTQQQMDLTNKLYDKKVTPLGLIELCQQGAIINGKIPKYRANCGRLDYHKFEPLSHWVVAFHFHYKDETPLASNAYFTTKFSNLDGKKTIKDLEIITQLLELGAKPTKDFKLWYATLLTYNLNNSESKTKLTKEIRDKNLEILLKHKPINIDKTQMEHIWKHTITQDNHEYVDLFIQYFTPTELQPGLNYCITDRKNILKNFGYYHEEYSKHLPIIVQKLIDKGATPDRLICITNDIDNSWEQNSNLEILKILCHNGACAHKDIETLTTHLQQLEEEKTAIFSAIELMKKNQSLKNIAQNEAI